MVGLPRGPKLKAVLGDRVVSLLVSYVDLALGQVTQLRKTLSGASLRTKEAHQLRIIGGKGGFCLHPSLSESHTSLCVGVVIDYCRIIDRLDVLFSDIYTKFCDAGGQTGLLR